MNLLLGIPAIIPIWLIYYIAATWVHPTKEEGDGFGIIFGLLVFGPAAAAGISLWWASNLPLARRSQLTAPRYWLLALAGTLIPTAVVISVWP